MKNRFIFKQCTNCHEDLTPGNCQVKVTDAGLWFTCECGEPNFMMPATVKSKSEEKAYGDGFKQLEIEWYEQRLKEINELKQPGGAT